MALRYNARPESSDTLTIDDFELVESLSPDGSYTRKLVRCCRGRLKSRLFVMRKIIDLQDDESCQEEQSIHSDLCHPSIVAFVASLPSYVHILEHCEAGTLTAYLSVLKSDCMAEPDVVALLKGIADALVFLEKRLVVHRDIQPDNILLTSSNRPKLCNFSSAVRLSSRSDRASGSYGAFEYRAPEIVSNSSYNCAADMWAFGCVVFLCAAGFHPFQARVPQMTADNICRLSYSVPRQTSDDLRDLYSDIFQPAADRISCHELIHHPFFCSSSTKENLAPATTDTFISVKASAFQLRRPLQQRSVLSDNGNSDLRRLLSDEVSSLKSGRRIVSEPLARGRGALSTRSSQPLRTGTTPSLVDTNSSPPSSPEPEPLAINRHRYVPCDPLINPLKRFVSAGSGLRVVSDTLSKHRTLVSSTAFDKPSLAKATVRPVAAAVPTTEAIPIGTVRPSPSTTHLMAPKSHKALHGHVTVLPSRSLLVDFREAERRRNLKGNTVLLVSPDGLDVKVYSAPHLSTPCCLTEPIAEYSLDALPSAYWKVYNDAAALVEKIKQRTPRLVMYEEGVKCSLMADRTPGDIELDFFSSDSASAQTSGGAGKPEATMRIRLSRKTRTVELIRDASTGSGAEWTRKTYTYLGDSFDSSDASRDMGSRAFDALSHFVRVCERMEALAGSDSLLDVDSGSMLGARSAPIKPSTTALRSPDLATCPVEEGGPVMSTSRSDGFLGLSVTQRPGKLWSTASTSLRQETTLRKDFDAISLRPDHRALLPDHRALPPDETIKRLGDSTKHVDDSTRNGGFLSKNFEWTALAVPGIATRFLPDVGWCIRYGSRVSQGGRFRIMYLDGATMDIDVDEEWVELQQKGDVVRVGMRDPQVRRKTGGRMKAFEEFVSMFDDDDDEEEEEAGE